MREVLDASEPTLRGWSEVGGDYTVGIAGYVGGATPHIWTPDEWGVARSLGYDPLPIYVAGSFRTGHETGATEANLAIAMMQSLGIGGVLALDVELAPFPDEGYFRGFAAACFIARVEPVLYIRAVSWRGLGFDPNMYLWLADWRPYGRLDVPAPTIGWQYERGDNWDYSVWDSDAPLGFWME